MQRDPDTLGLSMPAEWEPHAATWLAWPAAADLWQDNLEAAQAAFTGLCRAIADAGDGRAPAERLRVLVTDAAARAAAGRALAGLGAELVDVPYGDIWLRDTAPLFVRDATGAPAAVRFGFNGWGGKYVLPHDAEVAERVAARSGHAVHTADFVLEGGSVELDGEGTCLTTRQCLQNPNRNPALGQRALEALLGRWLGARRVLWLDQGLENDHTDGHVDTLARFVAPGVVVCMRPSGDDDPNRDVLLAIAADLAHMTDATGRRLRVVTVPSPGRVQDADGRVMPASYVNFYIANRTVVVPTYGRPHDEQVVRELAPLFPGRRTVGVPAAAILTGGGAFHCITQQEPR